MLTVPMLGFAISAQSNGPDALTWYGYESFTANSEYSNNYDFGDKDDQIYRKRRHKRRRKISPEKKGW